MSDSTNTTEAPATLQTGSPQPPSPRQASRERWYSPDGLGDLFICVALLAACGLLITGLLWHGHLIERAASQRDTGNMLYMFSAILAGGGALLLSGVIALAPLLSLALHQSYDAIFDVITRLQKNGSQPAIKLADKYIASFGHHLNFYKLINPPFFALWASAAGLLAIIIGWFFYGSWIDADNYHASVVFFFLSSMLCVAFAILSVSIFIVVKPGITKLRLFHEYFEVVAGVWNESDPRANIEMHAPRRFRYGAAVLAAILLGAAVWVWKFQPRETFRVAINEVAVASGPVFVAQRDVEDREGVNIQPIPFASGRQALDALLGGQVDLATAAETPFLLASAERKDLRVVLTIAVSEYRVIANGAAIKNVAELRKKKIGTLKGTAAEYFLYQLLESAGVRPNEVEVVNLEPADAVSALQNGSVDAVSLWEPYAWKAANLLGPQARVFENRDLYVEYFNLVTTTAVLGDPHRRIALEHVIEQILSASDYMKKDQQGSITLVARRMGMDVSELSLIWGRFAFPANLSAGLLTTMNNVEIWAATTQGRVPRPPEELRDLVDPTVLRSVDRRRVLLR